MNRREKRQWLKDFNEPTWLKFTCEECGSLSAVAVDVRLQEDYGENKGCEYNMVVFKCLACGETFENWESNYD